MKFLVILAIALSNGFPAGLYAAAQDYDGDSLSDFVIISAGDDRSFNWQILPSSSRITQSIATLGQTGERPILADWEGAGHPQVGTVRLTRGGRIEWRIQDEQGQTAVRTFGRKGDLVIAGADFNGNGTADAAVAYLLGRRAMWTIYFDLFTPQPISRKLSFGKEGDRLFFANPGAPYDWLGAVRKDGKLSQILLRDPLTGDERVVRGIGAFASDQTRPRPIPIRGPDGLCRLIFAKQGQEETALFIQSLTGGEPQRVVFAGTGAVVVGDFDAQPGEEVAVQGEGAAAVYSPDQRKSTFVSLPPGVLIDHVNIAQLGSSSSRASSDRKIRRR